MKKLSITYWGFYIAFFIVICAAIFLDKWVLVYVKPLATLSLTILYLKSVKKIDVLFPASMIVILVTDFFTYVDFLKYFNVIAILITTFYILCILLLRRFIIKEDVKPKKIISAPLIISVVLIFYLIFSITQLTLPTISDSLGYVMLIVLSMLAFSAFCFVIYVADRYEKSMYLFIAASCTLFVDALLAVNELYFYNRAFTVLINIAEILGIYFFAGFFIETKLKDDNHISKKYF